MPLAIRLARMTLAWIPATLGIGFAASRLVDAVNGTSAPGLATPVAGFAAAALVVGAAFVSLSD